jgi:magnesium chelatase family protein
MGKISGPLIDRIDLHLEVGSVPYQELATEAQGTSSEQMHREVRVARRRQVQRFADSRTRHNGQMNSRQIRGFCRLNPSCRELIRSSVNDLGLSARAHDKVLRVARTIADLQESDEVHVEHLQEAINFRVLDRQLWT